MNTTDHNQRGSVILYAMLSMSVMLAIGLTLNALFIAKLRAAAQQRDSMIALYAADSATELCLYEARQSTNEPNPRLVFDNDAVFQITNVVGQVDITGDCSVLGTASFDFRASGKFHGVNRTLEISQ